MEIGYFSKAVGVVLSSVLLQGCLQDQLERWIDRDTYDFNGIYQSSAEGSFLSFEDGVMRYVTPLAQMTKNFKVKEGRVHIILRNSPREQRDDLVMSIHGTGEVLTCVTCPKYKMANMWHRRADPQS
ncbi:hypothetical protein L4C34_14455 [Vibrio profundum]|uniref:hypothetical protein n=1 Tax=Vibrio profundum TaxID=2910247 RepID=UPI003D0F55CA